MPGSSFGGDWRKESARQRKETQGRKNKRKKRALIGGAEGAVSERKRRVYNPKIHTLKIPTTNFFLKTSM